LEPSTGAKQQSQRLWCDTKDLSDREDWLWRHLDKSFVFHL
jgi:hypothetical protein